MKLYHFINQTNLFTIRIGITNYNNTLPYVLLELSKRGCFT